MDNGCDLCDLDDFISNSLAEEFCAMFQAKRSQLQSRK